MNTHHASTHFQSTPYQSTHWSPGDGIVLPVERDPVPSQPSIGSGTGSPFGEKSPEQIIYEEILHEDEILFEVIKVFLKAVSR